MGTANPIGNHPKYTENKLKTNNPIQKVGADCSVRQNIFTILSNKLPLYIPAKTPIKNPTIPEKHQATNINTIEYLNLSNITVLTCCLYVIDVPKSPFKTFLPQDANLSNGGSFNPQ